MAIADKLQATEQILEPNSANRLIENIIVALYLRRRSVEIFVCVGLLLSAVVLWTLPNEYTSTSRLMPPDQQSLATPSVLSLMMGDRQGGLAMGGGGFLNNMSVSQTMIGVMESRTTLDALIRQFNLKRVFKCKTDFDAREKLAARTKILEDKRSGIISVEVTYSDPNLARAMAGAYVTELNSLLSKISNSSAQRERIFLEGRLNTIRTDLNTTSQELSEFSSHSATLNPESEGQSILTSATRLQGELISARSELSRLQSQYASDNIRVKGAEAQIAELQAQLNKIAGVESAEANETPGATTELPSLRKLPLLGVTYYNLSHQLGMQEELLELLTKEYEIAKIEEAKEIPVVKVLDQSQVPERKSSPHRLTDLIVVALLLLLGAISWVALCVWWEGADDGHFMKRLGRSVENALHSIRALE